MGRCPRAENHKIMKFRPRPLACANGRGSKRLESNRMRLDPYRLRVCFAGCAALPDHLQ
jgi:hypothetical protein